MPGRLAATQTGHPTRSLGAELPNRAKTVATDQGAHLKHIMRNKNSIEVGRYLVSPMIKPHADGGFSAAVSIRSGRGMASHDRVMRFVPRFDSQGAALRYAKAEGLAWVQAH
jgi:hypothetical protein